MANRFWVGGTATWDATVGTKWALTSGGAGGQAVPTAADDVFFDATSGAVTVTTSGTTTDVCRSLNCTGFTGTLSHATGTTITVGDGTAGASNVALKMVAGMTYTRGSATTSAWSFVSTSATVQTVTTGGKTFSNLTFNGVGGSWQFTDTMNANGSTSSSITLTQGTLDTNGQTVNTGIFSASGSSVRTLTLGASTINCTFNGNGWNISTGTNLTLNAGTSTIASNAFSGGSKTYNIVNLTNSGGSLTGTNTFATLTITCTASTANQIGLSGDQTITGTLTLTGNSSVNRLCVGSNTMGNTRTITAAAVSLTDVNFADITGAGAAAPFTGTRLGDMGGNSGITFTTPVTRYWVGNGGNWAGTTNWSTSTGGASGASMPLPQDDVIFDANSISSGAQTITANGTHLCKNLTMTAVTNNPTLSITFTQSNIYGSLALGAGMTFSGGDVFALLGRGSYTITTAGVSCANVLQVSAVTGTYTLADNLTLSGANYLSMDSGTFDANTFNVTGRAMLVLNAGTINMGTGTWTMNSTGTVWDSNGVTINSGTSTLVISDTSATAKTITTGTVTLNKLIISGDNVSWVGSTTLADLAVNTAALTNGLKMNTGTKTITHNITTNGSAGNLAKLVSSAAGTARTISVPGGLISVDFMSIQDSTVSGGAAFYAGANSTNVSGNTGWTFTAPPPSSANGFLATF